MVKIKYNEEKQVWDVLPPNSKEGTYIDGYLKKNLDDIKLAIKKDWDGIGYYCGYEGDGKTHKAAQDCYYIDPTITIDRCVFNTKQLIEAISKAKAGQAILMDEGYFSFSAKRWRDAEQQNLISLLTTIRKKRLFIAIVAPTFFDINKYILIHRSRYMVHVSARALERGYFAFFIRDKKHKLYVHGKKDENIHATTPNFFGRFGNDFPFDKIEYEKKKDAAIKEMMDQGRTTKTLGDLRIKEWCAWLILIVKETKGWSDAKVGEELSKVSEYEATRPRITELYGHIPKEDRWTDDNIN